MSLGALSQFGIDRIFGRGYVVRVTFLGSNALFTMPIGSGSDNFRHDDRRAVAQAEEDTQCDEQRDGIQHGAEDEGDARNMHGDLVAGEM